MRDVVVIATHVVTHVQRLSPHRFHGFTLALTHAAFVSLPSESAAKISFDHFRGIKL
jgi:hypothetical protein